MVGVMPASVRPSLGGAGALWVVLGIAEGSEKKDMVLTSQSFKNVRSDMFSSCAYANGFH